MGIGLRAGDAELLTEICGSEKRLFMRIGALLQEKVCLSELVIRDAMSSEALRSLLLDRKLGSSAHNEAAFSELLAEHNYENNGLQWSKEEEDAQEWYVLALDDELNNPLLAAMQPASHEEEQSNSSEAQLQNFAEQSMGKLLPTLDDQLRRPLEGLLAASGDDQRAAALEQLRYAAPSLHVVAPLMPTLLADGAELVRERAIGLLIAAGAHPLVIDLVRALQREDNETLERILERLGALPGDQIDLVLIAGLTVLERGRLNETIVRILQQLAASLAMHPILPRVVELLCLHGRNVNLTALFRALQKTAAVEVDRVLELQFGQGAEMDARILIYLSHENAGEREDLLQRGVDLLISKHDEPRERLALANALRRLNVGFSLSNLLAKAAPRFREAYDTTVYWLLSELSRDQRFFTEDANTIGEEIVHILTSGEGTHLVALLEHQVPSTLPCSHEWRRRFVEPLAELASRYRDDRSRELISVILSRLGSPAIDALFRVLNEHPNETVRCVTAEVIPSIVAKENIEVLVSSLEKLDAAAKENVNRARCRFICLDAAAQLATREDCPEKWTQHFQEICQELGGATISARSLLAAGPHSDSTQRLSTLDELLSLLRADIEAKESTTHLDPQTDEVTFILDERLGAHTDLLPHVFRGLVRLGTSPHLPPQFLRRLVRAMIDQWQAVSQWKIIWAPGNIQELAHHAVELATSEKFPNTLRVQIGEALLSRAKQLGIAGEIALLCKSGRGDHIQSISERCLSQIIQAANASYYAEDERDDLCFVLTQFLSIEELGNNQERLRSQICSLITSNRQYCTSRTRDSLRDLVVNLPEHLQDKLSWVGKIGDLEKLVHIKDAEQDYRV